MACKIEGGSIQAVSKKYSKLLQKTETMTSQALFGPDLDYESAEFADAWNCGVDVFVFCCVVGGWGTLG